MEGEPSAQARLSSEDPLSILTPEDAAESVNPLHYAAAMGDVKTVTKILTGKARRESSNRKRGQSKKIKVTVNALDTYHRTALVYAVAGEHLACAELLIKKGIDVNLQDKDGRTPLHWACFQNKTAMAALLLANGADARAVDSEGRTALHLATSAPSTHCILEVLKAQGPKNQLDEIDHHGMTPLHWACHYGSLAVVNLLLTELSVRFLTGDDEGKLPSHWAAGSGHAACLKACLRHWSTRTQRHDDEKSINFDIINAADAEGRSVLHLAIASGSADTIELVLAQTNVVMDLQDGAGRTALHWAAHMGLADVCHSLAAAAGSDLFFVLDATGATPLQYAVNAQKIDVLQAFLDMPDVIDVPDAYGRTGLMVAIAVNNQQMFDMIVDSKKSQLRVQDADGNSALHAAAYVGSSYMVERLLKHGSDPNSSDQGGRTPLFYGCEGGHTQVVAYLLNAHASMAYRDEEDRSLLHWAAVGGHVDICNLLVKGGLDADVIDLGGRTALHTAAFSGQPKVVLALVSLGCNMDMQDKQGITALHWAVSRKDVQSVQVLLDNGAFPNHTEFHEDRLTPLDYASMAGSTQLTAMLRASGGLSATEIRHMASGHIQAWWKGYKTRILLLSIWKEHLGRSSLVKSRTVHKARASQTKLMMSHSEARPDHDHDHPPDEEPMTKYKRTTPPFAKVQRKKESKASTVGTIAVDDNATRAEPASSKKKNKKQKKNKKNDKAEKVDKPSDTFSSGLKLPELQNTSSEQPAEVVKRPPQSVFLPDIHQQPEETAGVLRAKQVQRERSRVHDIRIKQRAAICIQRAYRRFCVDRKIRELEQPNVSKRKKETRAIHANSLAKANALYGTGLGLVRPTEQEKRRAKEGAVSFSVDPTSQGQQLAALTIQLAWRKHLTAKEHARLQRINTQALQLAERQSQRDDLQKRVYLSRVPRTQQWRPVPEPVARPAFLRALPSPAVTSFNMALTTYSEPLVELQRERLRKAEELLKQRLTLHNSLVPSSPQKKQPQLLSDDRVAKLKRPSPQEARATPPMRTVDPHEILRSYRAKRAMESSTPTEPAKPAASSTPPAQHVPSPPVTAAAQPLFQHSDEGLVMDSAARRALVQRLREQKQGRMMLDAPLV